MKVARLQNKIIWGEELRPVPYKNFGLADGETMTLATTGLKGAYVRREGDFLRLGRDA